MPNKNQEVLENLIGECYQLKQEYSARAAKLIRITKIFQSRFKLPIIFADVISYKNNREIVYLQRVLSLETLEKEYIPLIPPQIYKLEETPEPTKKTA